MKTLYLCGAGNPEGVRLARKINRARGRWDRIVVLDDDPCKLGQSTLGVEVAGPFCLLEEGGAGFGRGGEPGRKDRGEKMGSVGKD